MALQEAGQETDVLWTVWVPRAQALGSQRLELKPGLHHFLGWTLNLGLLLCKVSSPSLQPFTRIKEGDECKGPAHHLLKKY